MALTITFANGRQLPYLSALETEGYYSGASRRTLTCQLAADATGLPGLVLALLRWLWEVLTKGGAA